MPIQRISKGFKDISMSFKINPTNKDIITIQNETAIARSIRNIVLTNRGEKFFSNYFGSGVQRLLFENIDDITASSIQDAIEESINNWEPRVEILDVITEPDPDNNSYNVSIEYEIIGADVPNQELQFVLQSSR